MSVTSSGEWSSTRGRSGGIGRSEWERAATARTGAGAVFDPFETFATLRLEGPVHATSISDLFGVSDPLAHVFGDRAHFCTMDYATTAEVLNSADRFSNSGLRPLSEQNYGSVSFQASDGATHRQYRRLAQPAFSKHGMSLWSQWLAPRLDQLIDGFIDRGSANLYFEYCAQFPAYITAKAFGVPDDDFEEFSRWAALLQTGAGEPDELARVSQLVVDYLMSAISDRRDNPTDDLISILVQRVRLDAGEPYYASDDEILGLLRNIMPAGVGTTYRTLGIILVALLQRPELFARVVRDREMVRPVIEEALRWNPPVTWMLRVAEDDTVLRGTEIPKGSIVEGCIAAANRDPSVFNEPDLFDPFRESHPHLALSVGPHFCIGAQVGRMELEVSLNRLLDRLPGLRLDEQEPTPEITGLMFRMPTAVPARWG